MHAFVHICMCHISCISYFDWFVLLEHIQKEQEIIDLRALVSELHTALAMIQGSQQTGTASQTIETLRARLAVSHVLQYNQSKATEKEWVQQKMQGILWFDMECVMVIFTSMIQEERAFRELCIDELSRIACSMSDQTAVETLVSTQV